MSTNNIYINGLGLITRVIDEGKGPTVLLLHGNPDNADEWRNLIDLLKDDFRCIAPDLPGYGRTGGSFALPDNFDYSAQSQVKFVDAILQQLNISGPVTLVVHDIGGMMGVPWAAQNINRLHGMIYTNTVVFPYKWFDTAYRWGSESFTGKLLARFSMLAIGLSGGNLFRKIFAKQHPQLSTAELDRFVADFALNPIAKATSLREFRKITKNEFFEGFGQMRKTIAAAAPTLTIWGRNDPYIADNFAETIASARTIYLPNVGHWVPILAADVIAKEIRGLHKPHN